MIKGPAAFFPGFHERSHAHASIGDRTPARLRDQAAQDSRGVQLEVAGLNLGLRQYLEALHYQHGEASGFELDGFHARRD